jgi:hypothetical protein
MSKVNNTSEDGVVKRWLSSERYAHYFLKTNNNQELALLYIKAEMNISLQMTENLKWFELAFRNHMNEQLCQQYGSDWPMYQLTMFSKKKLTERKKKNVYAGNWVAENMSFGFWVGLMSHDYETLWRVCLRKTFIYRPKAVNRKKIHHKLDTICRLRNSIAHHHILDAEKLEIEWSVLIELVKWLDPALLTVMHKPDFSLLSIKSED